MITVMADDTSNSGSATASCASGDVAISGGVSSQTSGWFVRASNPNSTADNPTGWFGEIASSGDDDHSSDNSGDDSGDSSYSSSNSSSNDDSNDDSKHDDDDDHAHGPATGTVYVVCVTP